MFSNILFTAKELLPFKICSGESNSQYHLDANLGLSHWLRIFCIFTVMKNFFFKVCYCMLVDNFPSTFFKNFLPRSLLMESLDLKYQLIPQSVSFCCSYFNTSLPCISCTDLYTQNQFKGHKLWRKGVWYLTKDPSIF